jgi:hypothetical protein
MQKYIPPASVAAFERSAGAMAQVLSFAGVIDHKQLEYIDAIKLWVAERRADDALTVEEFCNLDDGSKLVALHRSQLEAMGRWYRRHPRENATPGVLSAIHYLADNSKGCCTIAQERLSRFFGRGRQHINSCISKLEESGDIRIEQQCGLPARIYPVMARVFAKKGDKLWLFDALAPEIGKRGRPKKPAVDTATPFQKPVVNATTPFPENLSSKNGKPVVNATTLTSLDSPAVEVEEVDEKTHHALAQPVCRSESLQPEGLITSERLARFCWLLDHWGRKDGKAELLPFSKATAKCWLEGIVHLGKHLDFETQEAALENMLSTAEATVYDPLSGKDRIGPKACKNFCETTFRGKLVDADKVRRALRNAEHADQVQAEEVQAIAADRVETRRKIGAKQLAAFDASVARNTESAPRPRKEASTRVSSTATRFPDDAPKIEDVRGTWISGFHANEILDGVEGANVPMVRRALLASAKGLNAGKPAPDRVIDWATRHCFFEVHGTPESRAGGWPALRARWVCLSAAFLDVIEAQHGLDSSEVEKIFRNVTSSFGFDCDELISADAYSGLQALIEGLVETDAALVAEDKAREQEEQRAAAMAREKEQKEQEERRAQSQSEASKPDDESGFGIIRITTGKRLPCVSLSAARINRLLIGEKLQNAFGEAWKLVSAVVLNWPNEKIESGIVKLVQLINAEEDSHVAAWTAFPEAFPDKNHGKIAPSALTWVTS